MEDVRETFEELRPLDLQTCHTVSDIVEGMRFCSFGARMVGEVAANLEEWFTGGSPPIVIFEGVHDTPLANTLELWAERDWCSCVCTAEQFLTTSATARSRVIVVGSILERHLGPVVEAAGELTFINKEGMAAPGQVRDGYFPRVVFTDPCWAIPLLDVVLKERIEGVRTRASDMIERAESFGGLAAEVAHGTSVLREMWQDRDCTVFVSIAGAMTIAKMGLLICDMLDSGRVAYLASTGALMAHGLVEGMGLKHYKYHPHHGDQLLADQAINRVTDTLEPEENFDHIDKVINDVLAGYSKSVPISPSQLHRAIGQHVATSFPNERGILASAYRQNVPVVVPAFCDSEIGNDVYVHNAARRQQGQPPVLMDLELDTKILFDLAAAATRAGIFSIGGGVPRNNTQNVAPLIEIYNSRLGAQEAPMKFYYGCRIDPTPLWYGNLSGCTYSEGGSWRKFDLSGRLAEVHADATLTWPFMLKAVLETV